MSSFQGYPAELSFKKHAESVRTSLQIFNALRTIPSNGIVSSPLRLALEELVKVAVCDLILLPKLY